MASGYFLIPEKWNWGALKNYRQSRCNKPSYREDANTVYSVPHPPIGKQTDVEEQDGDDDKADRDGPADLLDVDRLSENMSETFFSEM